MMIMMTMILTFVTFGELLHMHAIIHIQQELIRRWDRERELLRSAPRSYPNSLK